MASTNIQQYLSGEKLYGDDFDLNQIKVWFEQESVGYADLGSKDAEKYVYCYHNLNSLHGFNKIKHIPSFEHALGMGAAYGYEFEPIADKIKKLTIIEPSDSLMSSRVGNLVPNYVKPQVDGKLPFADNSFDLITCFGTLHHIPNVSFVLSEMIRVLKPNGVMLVREPVISMGDWRKPRKGLTNNERGIPVRIFDNIFKSHNMQIISRSYCFTLMPVFLAMAKPLLKKPIFMYQAYLVVDKFLSKIFSLNRHYHPQNKWQHCTPSNVFYVVSKKR